MAPDLHSRFDPIELSDPAMEHDGLRHLTFYSPALRGRGDVSLFVPQGAQFPAVIPLVLLLHGVYGSHWAWFLKSAAHRTAQQLIDTGSIRPMLIATPSDGLYGDGSGYLPYPGRNSEQWIVADVPECVREQFPSAGPLFLAGLSMGGYGALRLGFKYPDRFTAISAHSAITDVSQMQRFIRHDLRLESFSVGETDILHWLDLHRAQVPALRFDCGQDDNLFRANLELHSELTRRNVPHVYAANPGGHVWTYWREHIAATLQFFEQVLRSQDLPVTPGTAPAPPSLTTTQSAR